MRMKDKDETQQLATHVIGGSRSSRSGVIVVATNAV